MKTNIEQLRARYARDMFTQHRAQEKAATTNNNQQEVEPERLKSYLHALPAMIQMNGFGQAYAFYLAGSVKEPARGAIAETLANWLKKQKIYELKSTDDVSPGIALMEAICDGSMRQYQLAAIETQALLVWLKKFADIYLTKDASDKSKEQEIYGA